MAIPLPNKEQLKALWEDPDMSIRMIARKYFVADVTISGLAVRYGLMPRDGVRNRFDAAAKERFAKAWASGLSQRDIAKEFRIGKKSVPLIAARLGLKTRPPAKNSRRDVVSFDNPEPPRPGDPTPEEIAIRRAECDRRRLAMKGVAQW